MSSVLRALSSKDMSHLKAEAHPEEDQMEWMRTGYTQELMNNEYKMYASNRVRSAMAPETMVQAVAANCNTGKVGVRGWSTHDTSITECRQKYTSARVQSVSTLCIIAECQVLSAACILQGSASDTRTR